MQPGSSIFDNIAQLNAGGVPRGGNRAGARVPKWQPSVEECVIWLRKAGLTRAAHSYQTDPLRDPGMLLGRGNPVKLGIPSHRAERRRKTELDSLKEHYRKQHQGTRPSQTNLDQLWKELKDPASAVRVLALERLPADALAFYRPFHFFPHEEWGSILWWNLC